MPPVISPSLVTPDFSPPAICFLCSPPFLYCLFDPYYLPPVIFRPQIRAEAAYLYDAVHLYAVALNNTLRGGGDPEDPEAIMAGILGKTYKSAMGSVY